MGGLFDLKPVRFLFLCLLFLFSLSFVCQFAQGIELEVDPSLTLETWMTYDDNIYLTTRRDLEAEIDDPIRYRPGESDVFARFVGDLRLKYSLKESADEILRGTFRYRYTGQYYTSEHDENNFQNLIEGDIHLMPDETLSLRIYGGVRWDERRPGAAYGMLDSSRTWVGVEGIYLLTEKDRLSASYEYGYRDYQTSEARGTPSSYDYSWHRLCGKYQRQLVGSWNAEAFVAYRWRYYDQDARTAEGRKKFGVDRQDRLPEFGAQITGSLTSTTALRLGYQFAENRSSGPFYRYESHQLFGLLYQQLTEKLSAYGYLERQWKPFDKQVAYGDPLVTLTPKGTRNDRRWLALVGLEYQVCPRLSLVGEYTRLSNSSNDDTSPYRGNQYSLGMIWQF